MTKITILCILLFAAYATWQFDSSSRPEWKKISPFTSVTFENEKIIAEYEGTFYEVSAIEGISSEQLIETAKNHYGARWQKRIREDIAEVLVAAGAPDSTQVDLILKDLLTGAETTIKDAEMTEENRRKIYTGS
ncbi:MAG: hypothetical protein P1V20_12245 [Verrucomicrobiales bacterium]|nr:hypothetical protein [Verrucomicrobiales bacterium]